MRVRTILAASPILGNSKLDASKPETLLPGRYAWHMHESNLGFRVDASCSGASSSFPGDTGREGAQGRDGPISCPCALGLQKTTLGPNSDARSKTRFQRFEKGRCRARSGLKLTLVSWRPDHSQIGVRSVILTLPLKLAP